MIRTVMQQTQPGCVPESLINGSATTGRQNAYLTALVVMPKLNNVSCRLPFGITNKPRLIALQSRQTCVS